jgi:hypothetical protein
MSGAGAPVRRLFHVKQGDALADWECFINLAASWLAAQTYWLRARFPVALPYYAALEMPAGPQQAPAIHTSRGQQVGPRTWPVLTEDKRCHFLFQIDSTAEEIIERCTASWRPAEREPGRGLSPAWRRLVGFWRHEIASVEAHFAEFPEELK